MKKFLFSLIFPFILAACAPFQDNTPQSHSFFAMGTYMKITAYGKNSETTFLDIEKEIRRLDALLSAENPASEISRLSTEGRLIISNDTVRVITLAESWNRSTGGAFDISLAPLSKLWGFPHGPYRVPTETERAEALGKTGMKYISYNKETGEYFLESGCSLDLGGLAKGTAAEKAADILNAAGIKSALLDLGGNIKVIGMNPGGRPWRIALRHPDDADKTAGTLSVSDTSIVTSGDYERYFMANGRRYHHIFNPHTGEPAQNGLRAVTVICKDSEKADILSTALFVMGEKEAALFWKEHRGEFQMILFRNDNTLMITPDLQKIFTSELPVVLIS
jgi:FAD:protein FMN transferase